MAFLDLGVAAMIGLQFQRLPVPVGDEAVIAVSGEEGELGTGRRLHPPDNEPHRCGVQLDLERGVSRLGDIGCAVHPVGNGSPVLLWYRLDQVPQAFVLADGDGEAGHPFPGRRKQQCGRRSRCRARTVSCPLAPPVAHPPHRLPQEVGGAAGGVGAALAQPGHQHVAAAGGGREQRVIATGAGIAVVGALPPWPCRRSRRWSNPGRWSGARRRVRPRLAMPVPATGGSRGRVDGRGPSGSCAGRSRGWMAP